MMKETPAKVFSLLATACMSLALLFAVTTSNASFSQMETPLPDPLAPQKVVAFLDNTASGYSNFLQAYLFEPAKADLAYYRDNAKWVIDESADPILAMTGLKELASVEYYQNLDYVTASPQVAGAYTERGYASAGGFNMDSLYSLLIR